MVSLRSFVLSIIIAPSALFSSILAILSILQKNTRSSSRNKRYLQESSVAVDQASSNSSRQEGESLPFQPLLAERSPEQITVRQAMDEKDVSRMEPPKTGYIDQDIAFMAGQASMPLSVYESPLMESYRSFRQMRRDNNSDGYYVVHKERLTYPPRNIHDSLSDPYKTPSSSTSTSTSTAFPLQQTAVQHNRSDYRRVLPSSNSDSNQGGTLHESSPSDIMLLYGRGPVFQGVEEGEGYAGLDD